MSGLNASSIKPAKKKPKLHYAWIIVLAVSLVQFGDAGVFVNTAGLYTQPVTDDLGISRASFSLYFSIVCIVMTIAAPIARKIMEKFKARIVFPLLIILEALCYGMMSQYNSVYGWYISAIGLGFGNAFITYQMVPYFINNWFRTKKYGLAFGIAAYMTTLGGGLLQPVGGHIIANYGWRTSYIVLTIIALVISLPPAIFLLRKFPSEKGLMPYGFDEIEERKNIKPEEHTYGLDLKNALKSPLFYFCIVFTVLMTFGCNIIYHFSAFAYTIGFPVDKGSMFTGMTLIAGVLGDIITGVLTDKFGVRTSIGVNLLCGILGFVILLSGNTTFGVILLGAFMFGLGYALLNTASPLITLSVVGPKHYTRIFMYVSMSLTATSAVAQVFFGWIYDDTKSYVGGIIIALAGWTLALLICLIVVTLAKKYWSRNTTAPQLKY